MRIDLCRPARRLLAAQFLAAGVAVGATWSCLVETMLSLLLLHWADIAGADGADAAPGTPGELIVQGPGLLACVFAAVLIEARP